MLSADTSISQSCPPFKSGISIESAIEIKFYPHFINSNMSIPATTIEAPLGAASITFMTNILFNIGNS